MLISDILKNKGLDVKTIRATLTIQEACDRLAADCIGSLVVTSGVRRIEGIITERDITRGIAHYGREVHTLQVSELMSRPVRTCTSALSVAEAARAMTLHRIRHLPVTQDDQLIGIVSIGDILKSRLDEIQLEARVLRDIALAAR